MTTVQITITPSAAGLMDALGLYSLEAVDAGQGRMMLRRDPQLDRDLALGKAVREWLDIYGITARQVRAWMADPLKTKRLTEQCSKALYRRLAVSLENERRWPMNCTARCS